MQPPMLPPIGKPKPAFRIPEADPPAPVNHALIPDIPPPGPKGELIYKIASTFFDRERSLCFTSEHTKVHTAVLGESGSGKSKFLEQLVRFWLHAGKGGLIADPANELVDNLLAFVAYRYKKGDEAMAKRCHVLTVEPHLRFRLDVFQGLPRRSAVSPHEYVELLDARSERVLLQILRRLPSTEIEVMNRLIPRLKAVVMACGVDYDGKGTHLGLGAADELCNPESERFGHLMSLVFPHLPRQQQDVFREIYTDKPERNWKDRWESTQNRINRTLSPAVKLSVGAGPSIDFAQAVANREMIFLRGKQSRRLPPIAASTMAGFVIDGFLAVKEGEEDVAPHQRVESSLLIDEAGDQITEGLIWSLANDRKARLEITLAAQNYMRLCNDNVALGDHVLTACGSIFCFAQRGRSADEVVERLFRGNESYTRRMRKVQRQYGWFTVVTPDVSVSRNETHGRTSTVNEGRTETDGNGRSVARGTMSNWAESRTTNESIGSSNSRGDSCSEGSNSSTSYMIDGVIIANTSTVSRGKNASSSASKSSTDSYTKTEGESETVGGGRTNVDTAIENHSIARSRVEGQGTTSSEGHGCSLSLKTGFLPDLRFEQEWDGGYEEGPPEVQRAAFLRWLHVLDTAEFFASLRGCPVAIPGRVVQVKEFWDEDLKAEAIRAITRIIAEQHGYMFDPRESAENVSAPAAALLSPPAVPPGAAGEVSDGKAPGNPFGN